jgi:hypothetical protein
VQALIDDLIERGLDPAAPRLFVIDGSKALSKAIRRSKTDQEGQGVTIAIVRGGSCCPVTALKAWLEAAGVKEGHLPASQEGRPRAGQASVGCRRLRSGQGLRRAAGARSEGLRRAQPALGAITTAAKRGASIFRIKDLSR